MNYKVCCGNSESRDGEAGNCKNIMSSKCGKWVDPNKPACCFWK